MDNNINSVACPTYIATINLAGDLQDAKRCCKAFCNKIGLCVAVEPITYVYSGGCEEGVKVTLINYPKYPNESSEIAKVALELANLLRVELYQDSVLVSDVIETRLISSRLDRE